MKPAPASPGAPRRMMTRSDIALTLTGVIVAAVATVASLWSATINRRLDDRVISPNHPYTRFLHTSTNIYSGGSSPVHLA